jgi:hypothetical protein
MFIASVIYLLSSSRIGIVATTTSIQKDIVIIIACVEAKTKTHVISDY